jgi:hypothetical protein
VVYLEAGVIVDAGLPVHIPVPLDETRPTSRQSPYHAYSATPDGSGNFLVQRDKHPRPDCFTLIDTPVDDVDFRAITTADYDRERGQFLKRLIVVRVIDGRIWRFSSAEAPYLESFAIGEKTYHYQRRSTGTAESGA